ncbi:DegT/DnrJ/EryC1/StrS family aminotransferase, partial [bacterium]|nr:DegT/DnrJ/EryC1/StrS family aminotransferase [bacterium]
YLRLPLGGFKNRMHQLTSAMARVQLKYYQERIEEIQKAFNYFWDKLEDTKGVKAHRPPVNSDSDMGGWYAAKGLYVPEELGGLPVTKFVEALQAEGVSGGAGCNLALHLHPLLNDCDVYNEGKPTRIAHSDRDLRQPKGSLPVSEGIQEFVFQLPGFKHFDTKIIDEYVAAYKKVAVNFQELL